jgi:hypothetical protein
MKNLSFVMLVAGLMIAGCSKPADTTDPASPAPTPATSPATSPDATPAASPDATPAASPDATPAATPGGTTAEVGGVTEADLGVPFYPGSTAKPNMSSKTDANGMTMVASVRDTTDAPDKVGAFYKDALTKAGYKVNVASMNGTTSVTGTKGKGTFAVAISKDTMGGTGNAITIGAQIAK